MHDFPPLRNDLIIRAARGEETERAPVWAMRQAGRSLPEFLKVREKHGFFEICRTPELATEVTMQPIRRYKGLLDAAIIFSDILVIPQAFGMVVEMNPGPHFPETLDTPADIQRLLHETVNVDKELGYVYEAITQTRIALNGEVPLIGFVGAPWTLMAYMIEGGGSKTFNKSKAWLFKYPEESKALLNRIADVCADHLVGQVKAGAQLVQVFDSWASELSPYDYRTFSLYSLIRLLNRFKSQLNANNLPQVPTILFAKGANTTIADQALSGYDVLSLEWTIEGGEARRIVDEALARAGQTERTVALQGNLDPSVLPAGAAATEEGVKRMSESFKGGLNNKPRAWVANLGHGVTPQMTADDVECFLKNVWKYSKANAGET
ncbi:hypothetical protein Clacol_002044 [Clathrus columnatus]|uniref:Uroporphyrinogen decarboxylase n=1 Tax=Clathrus columnatus TaxID=1419009 RepID=A0AAV5A4Z9_9AGAM|nr:hypothetical protein Clacol_002044 [Clathrus columnatus]